MPADRRIHGEQLLQHLKRRILGLVPQERGDEQGGDPELRNGVGQHRCHAIHAGRQGHAAGQVRLRIEHDFGVPDPGERCPGQVRPGHVGEVLLGLQHSHIGVVKVQERLQIREFVAGAQFVQVCIRQPDSVAFRERKDQVGLKRSLDMQVEFRDRQRTVHLLGNLGKFVHFNVGCC